METRGAARPATFELEFHELDVAASARQGALASAQMRSGATDGLYRSQAISEIGYVGHAAARAGGHLAQEGAAHLVHQLARQRVGAQDEQGRQQEPTEGVGRGLHAGADHAERAGSALTHAYLRPREDHASRAPSAGTGWEHPRAAAGLDGAAPDGARRGIGAGEDDRWGPWSGVVPSSTGRRTSATSQGGRASGIFGASGASGAGEQGFGALGAGVRGRERSPGLFADLPRLKSGAIAGVAAVDDVGGVAGSAETSFAARAVLATVQRAQTFLISAVAALTGTSVATVALVAVVVVAAIAAVVSFLPLMNQTQEQEQASASIAGALGATTSAVPAALIPLYNAAGGDCLQMPATLLAAQGKQESGFNPNAVSPVGARGVAQFMPATWAVWGKDADGDGVADVLDPADAIAAQGRYMCDLVSQIQALIDAGTVTGNVQLLALAAYNAGISAVKQYGGVPPYAETQAYAPAILKLAAGYGATLTTSPAAAGGGGGGPVGVGVYSAVINALSAHLGTPYVWGGGTVSGPSAGTAGGTATVGWDCSSFIQYGFYQGTGGKITLPRTAGAQAVAYQQDAVPAAAIAAGDLLFYGGIASADHVALYIGGGQMLEEPHTGVAARVTAVRTNFSIAERVPLP